jgi:hypothetical protein
MVSKIQRQLIEHLVDKLLTRTTYVIDANVTWALILCAFDFLAISVVLVEIASVRIVGTCATTETKRARRRKTDHLRMRLSIVLHLGAKAYVQVRFKARVLRRNTLLKIE